MAEFKDFRKATRSNWGVEQDAHLNLDQIRTGALLRIADATELMAKRYQELISQRESFERSADFWRGASDRRDRQIRALKGVITKLKRAQKPSKESTQ